MNKNQNQESGEVVRGALLSYYDEALGSTRYVAYADPQGALDEQLRRHGLGATSTVIGGVPIRLEAHASLSFSRADAEEEREEATLRKMHELRMTRPGIKIFPFANSVGSLAHRATAQRAGLEAARELARERSLGLAEEAYRLGVEAEADALQPEISEMALRIAALEEELRTLKGKEARVGRDG